MAKESLYLIVALKDCLLRDVKLPSTFFELLLQLFDLCLELGTHLFRASLQALSFPPQLLDQVVDLRLHLGPHRLEFAAHSFGLFFYFELVLLNESASLRLKLTLHLVLLIFVLLLHFGPLLFVRFHQFLDLGLQLGDKVAALVFQEVDLVLELLDLGLVFLLHSARLLDLGLLLFVSRFKLVLQVLLVQLQAFYLLVQLRDLLLEVISGAPQNAVQSLDLRVQSAVLSLVFRVVLLHGFLQAGYLVEGLAQFLLRLLQLSSQFGGVQVAISGCLAHSLQLILELLYPAIALGDVLILALDGEFFLLHFFLKLLDLGLQLLHLVLDDGNLLIALGTYFVDLNFGVGLLDFLGLFDGLPQLLLSFGEQLLPLLLSLLLEGVFAVHLLLEQVVVLSIVLLDVRCQLFGVCFFKGFDGLVVIFKILKLTLVVFAPLVKLFLYLLKVHFHVLSFFFVLLLELGLALRHLLLVQIEVLLAILPFLKMLLLKLPYFLLQVFAFLEPGDLVLLFQDDFICLLQHDLHFFLVAAADGLLRELVLLVFGVELEDYFR